MGYSSYILLYLDLQSYNFINFHDFLGLFDCIIVIIFNSLLLFATKLYFVLDCIEAVFGKFFHQSMFKPKMLIICLLIFRWYGTMLGKRQGAIGMRPR